MTTQPQPQTPKSNSAKWLIVFAAVLIILCLIFGAAIFFVWQNKKEKAEKEKKEVEIELLKQEMSDIQTKLNEKETASPTPTKTPIEILTASYNYDLEYVKTPPEDLTKVSDEELLWVFDQKLVRINQKTNKKEVIIESTKKALPELQDQFNITLSVLAAPDNASEIYFTKLLMQTDAPPHGIYAFNLENKKFRKLKISDDFSGWTYLLTDDKSKVVAPFLFADYGSVRQLLLFDLTKDEKKVLVALPESETLDVTYGGIASEIKMKWLDEKTIEYEVYDQTGVTPEKVENMERKPKIAARKVVIE